MQPKHLLCALLVAAFTACPGEEPTDPDAGKPLPGRDAATIFFTPDAEEPFPTDAQTLPPSDAGMTIGWCKIVSAAEVSLKAGRAATVYAQILAQGLTPPAGQGAGVVGHLGYGPTGSDPRSSASWVWAPASYDKDVGQNDEYQAALSPAETGTYAFAFRFRVGAEEAFCDAQPQAEGFDLSKLGRVEVSPPAVDWCRLQFPSSANVVTGQALSIYGQALLQEVTNQTGAGAGIEAELGFGPSGSDGSTSGSWTWAAAVFSKDDGNNDEYQADISPATGSWAYAYRFRAQGGTWTYCDLDSSQNGYSAAQQGAVTVGPVKPATVDWCRLEFPPSATVPHGGSLHVTGQVFVAGVSEAAGQGTLIEGQLGYGAAGTNGSTDGAWTWSAATYEKDSFNNDQYQADVAAPSGSWSYAYRFRFKQGDWLYCDLDGNNAQAGGYAVDRQGSLTVGQVHPAQVDWCRLQPLPLSQIDAGASVNVAGQAFVSGVTEATGQGAQVEGQVGYGPAGSDGSTDAAWSWTSVSYSRDYSNNDEYQASLSPPEGSWAVAYRFRYKGGSWLYCDLDGNDGSAGGYATAQQGSLTVAAPVVGWCRLQGPATGTIVAGAKLAAQGQVFVLGVTEAAGQGANVEGQLGYGPTGTDGSTSTAWTWGGAATWSRDYFNNDEYSAEIAPAEGTWSFAYRFRHHGGAWLYCDLDGSEHGAAAGYSAAQQGALTVGPAVVSWCRLQPPATGTVSAGTPFKVTGQVLVTGVTEAANQGANVTGEAGWGPAGSDGSSAAGWTWTASAFARDYFNNDEYEVSLSPPAGSWAYSYRFRHYSGAWLYCDLDGNSGGAYSTAQQGALTVNP